jgi:hypothetical protein
MKGGKAGAIAAIITGLIANQMGSFIMLPYGLFQFDLIYQL